MTSTGKQAEEDGSIENERGNDNRANWVDSGPIPDGFEADRFAKAVGLALDAGGDTSRLDIADFGDGLSSSIWQASPSTILTEAARGRGEVPMLVHSEIEDSKVRTLESIRSTDIGKLVVVDAQVIDHTDPFPNRIATRYECMNCAQNHKVRHGRFDDPDFPSKCTCDNASIEECHEAQHKYTTSQYALLQDLHVKIGGDNPTDMAISLDGTEQIEAEVQGGDRVRVLAEVRLRDNGNRSEFYLDVLGLEHLERSFDAVEVSDEDRERIESVAELDDVHDQLAASIAPHLSGGEEYDLGRHAILYQIAGASNVEYGGETSRGELHMGFIGDPGTGKSDLGKSAVRISPKSRSVVGDNVTVPGLLGSCKPQEKFGQEEWTITGGAMVQADKGLVHVDEFDNASKEIQDGMLTPLSDGKVKIDKVIKATLPSRTSALITANPRDGRFDRFDSVTDQIDLIDPLFDRLDLVIPFFDDVDPEKDAAVWQKFKPGNDTEDDTYSEDFLQKYISVAKEYNPELSEEAYDYLQREYVELRDQSSGNRKTVMTRMTNTLNKLAHASARLRLSETVTLEDAERAYNLALKSLQMVASDEHGNLDADKLTSGEDSEQRSLNEVVKTFIRDLKADQDSKGVDENKLVEHVLEKTDLREHQVKQTLSRLHGKNEVWKNSAGYGVSD
jgi:replicative DNA helicase Mcm